ncbi:hypothetical protein HELRODRAFT_169292 [Helobdella robusta]|uniref:Uncharacterized protein n=1 Tax=Helobdella robusta TaxID=6412 RepID=T1F1Q9_HELRO|nr:hypothetical protein HELRODRAFT_169292 [Helobdella robusta]ESO08449.1 hypothetical protein HELRODRAFT_169292 [Helobdella robusta]
MSESRNGKIGFIKRKPVNGSLSPLSKLYMKKANAKLLEEESVLSSESFSGDDDVDRRKLFGGSSFFNQTIQFDGPSKLKKINNASPDFSPIVVDEPVAKNLDNVFNEPIFRSPTSTARRSLLLQKKCVPQETKNLSDGYHMYQLNGICQHDPVICVNGDACSSFQSQSKNPKKSYERCHNFNSPDFASQRGVTNHCMNDKKTFCEELEFCICGIVNEVTKNIKCSKVRNTRISDRYCKEIRKRILLKQKNGSRLSSGEQHINNHLGLHETRSCSEQKQQCPQPQLKNFALFQQKSNSLNFDCTRSTQQNFQPYKFYKQSNKCKQQNVQPQNERFMPQMQNKTLQKDVTCLKSYKKPASVFDELNCDFDNGTKLDDNLSYDQMQSDESTVKKTSKFCLDNNLTKKYSNSGQTMLNDSGLETNNTQNTQFHDCLRQLSALLELCLQQRQKRQKSCKPQTQKKKQTCLQQESLSHKSKKMKNAESIYCKILIKLLCSFLENKKDLQCKSDETSNRTELGESFDSSTNSDVNEPKKVKFNYSNNPVKDYLFKKEKQLNICQKKSKNFKIRRSFRYNDKVSGATNCLKSTRSSTSSLSSDDEIQSCPHRFKISNSTRQNKSCRPLQLNCMGFAGGNYSVSSCSSTNSSDSNRNKFCNPICILQNSDKMKNNYTRKRPFQAKRSYSLDSKSSSDSLNEIDDNKCDPLQICKNKFGQKKSNRKSVKLWNKFNGRAKKCNESLKTLTKASKSPECHEAIDGFNESIANKCYESNSIDCPCNKKLQNMRNSISENCKNVLQNREQDDVNEPCSKDRDAVTDGLIKCIYFLNCILKFDCMKKKYQQSY